MSKDEKNNKKIENETTVGPAPPIKPKKYIKYRIIHGSFRKSNNHMSQNNVIKDNNKLNNSKKNDKLNSIPSNDSWSMFSPNFIENSNEKDFTPNPNYFKIKTVDEKKFYKKISKSVINFPQQDNEKIIKLEKEINELKETNQNILNLIMEKEKENRELINIIDKYKTESIEKLSNYLNYIEELGKKFKLSNDEDENLNNEINNNSNEDNEITIELNRNKQLKKILSNKNEEFSDINNAIQKLIFNDDSPLLNESEINSNNNNINNIIEEKEEEIMDKNEIINIRNEYNNLKKEYDILIDKYNQEQQNNKKSKNRIKFVYKDIPQNIKQSYESKIKELIEENQKIKNTYNMEIENITINIGSLKVEFLNKQFEKETKLLNTKKKIKSLIKQCKASGIILNNEIINIV